MDQPRFVSPREKLNLYSWKWRKELEDVVPGSSYVQRKYPSVSLAENNCNVLFHWGWSSGTAVVRGDTPLTCGQNYFWEIQVSSVPYGTDVMVGVGTDKVSMFLTGVYVSLLGSDNESWGFSYTGKFHHNGRILLNLEKGFTVGDVVGLHLNMWSSSLTLFVNGVQVCVINDLALKKQALFPMMCSTSASTCLKLIYAYSCNNLLQQKCLESLKDDSYAMNVVMKIPGLFRECDKLFVKTKYKKITENEPEITHVDSDVSLHKFEFSDDEESDVSIPGSFLALNSLQESTTNQKVLRSLVNVKCMKHGSNAQRHFTRSSLICLCDSATSIDDNTIDIYAGI